MRTSRLTRALLLALCLLTALLCAACASDPVTYTVTFVQDGCDPITRTVTEGGAVADIPTPKTVLGYTVAWEAVDLSAVTSDLTVQAVRTPIEYPITYHLNGGTGGANPATYTIETSHTLLAATKTGYTFGGWFANEAYTGTPVTAIAPGETEAKVLYAKWIPNENALVFHPNGGTGNMAATEVVTDTPSPLPQTTFTRSGYTFLGWATTANGAVVYANGATFTPSGAGPFALYAVWEANQNTLVLHPNGGTGAMASLSLHTDESTTLPTCTFTRAGYTFLGWATTENGEAVYTDGASFTMSADETVSLYATWEANRNTLILDANGVEITLGNAMPSLTLRTDETTTLPTCTLTRTGYTFQGWATEASGEVAYVDGASFTMSADKIVFLYAVWELETYTIEYRLDGGDPLTDVPLTFTVLDLPFSLPTPTKADAMFCGWFEDTDLTIHAAAVTEARSYTLYAGWGGLYFAQNDEGAYTVTGFYGPLTSIEIPARYNNFYVNKIGTEAFKNCTTLASVIIHDGINEVGKDAFLGCPCVETVDGVQYVDTWAVGGTETWLGFVSFRAGTDGVAVSAFEGRLDVLRVTFPAGFRYINDYAFNLCHRLVEYYNLTGNRRLVGYNYAYDSVSDAVHDKAEDPSFIDVVGDFYFLTKNDAYALLCSKRTGADLVLPENYKGNAYKIGAYAFYRDPNLHSVTIPACVKEIEGSAFDECRNLASVDLGSVTSVGVKAFYGCYSLTSITIPSTLTTIGNMAFSSCIRLVEVYNLSTSFILTPGGSSNVAGGVASRAKVIHTDASTPSLLETTEDGFVFLSVDGTYYLITYVGTETDLVLPETYKDSTYIIAAHAFYQDTTHTSITVPDGVVMIERSAFTGSSLLVTENGVQYADKWAVDAPDVYYLKQLSLREDTVGIAVHTFAGANSLTMVTLPDSVKYIGANAFDGARHLIRVTLPAGVQTIGKSAFSDCFLLTEIYNYPTDATILGDNCFDGVDHLWAKHAGTTEPSILDIVDNFVFTVQGGKNLLIGYLGSDATLTLPENYRGASYTIYDKAFYDVDFLVSVTIPDTVTILGEDVFMQCDSLETAVLSKDTTVIPAGLFYSCEQLKNFTLPAGVVEIGYAAFEGCEGLSEIVLPYMLATVEQNAFFNCYNLKIYYEGAAIPTAWHQDWNRNAGKNLPAAEERIVLRHNNVTTDPDFDYVISGGKVYLTAYKGAGGNVTVPAVLGGYPVVSIGTIFKAHQTIETVSLPSIPIIPERAFFNCPKLTKVTLSEGTVTIGKEAFRNSSLLAEVNLPSTVREIGPYAFYVCSALKEIHIPEGVTEIGKETFYSCASLATVTLPSTLVTIWDGAFQSCKALTEITIPATVTCIGVKAFYACNELSKVTFEVTTGWFYSYSSESTGGTKLTISSVSDAARYLRQSYVSYYIKRK